MAQLSRKRKHDEIDHIDSVDKPLASTSVHGAITSLSPAKQGRKSIFLDGTLADDTSKIRIAGFDAQQQKTLNDYQQNNIPIQLINCEVKPSRHGHGYELILKSCTQIKESPKKLNVPALINATFTGPKTITLDALPTMGIFEKVTTAVKAIAVKERDSVGDKQRQDVIVADETGTAQVCLWEDDINKLVKNQVTVYTVREYQSTKYLLMAREGTEIVPIADIGIVTEAVRDEPLVKTT